MDDNITRLPFIRVPQRVLRKFKTQSMRRIGVLCCSLVFFGYFLLNMGSEVNLRRHYDMSIYDMPCELPELDPFSEESMKHFRRIPPIECEKTPRVMYVNSNNELEFNLTALDAFKLQQSDVECICSSVYRRTGDWLVSFGDSIPCGPNSQLNTDFFRIQCSKNGMNIMDELLTRINVDKQRTDRVPRKDEYSVLMIGLDSVSRSMAMRSLNKTMEYITKDLGGYDMKTFMKVGDNTYPNLISLLTGKFENELPEMACLQKPCDLLPLIWKWYSKKGYVTLYSEDRPGLNTFTWHKKGFTNQPTNHYMLPFWHAAVLLHPEKHISGFVEGQVKNIFGDNSLVNRMTSVVKYEDPYPDCFGNIPKFMNQLNYIKQFMHSYKRAPRFAFNFFTDVAHSDVNCLSTVDDDLLEFFKWLKNDGHLDNTIIILFADHGPRGGQVTHTLRMENSLPLLNIILPNELQKRFPNVAKHMAENRYRLTSTFDLHATLRTILNGEFENPSSFKIGDKVRGKSMFGEISKQRSCYNSNIPDHYCVCYRVTPVNITNDVMVPKIAEALVSKINSLLKKHSHCAVLRLNRIIDVRKMSEALTIDNVVKKHFWSKEVVISQNADISEHYTIVTETLPGNAQFYASINIDQNDVISVSGDIDRINKYGNQSHCIDDHLLHPFCYCNKQL